MASAYERELRAVLAGLPDGVRAVTRSCDALTTARAMRVIERPFMVVRAAGSGGEGSGDLVALRGDLCFPIEVKTTKARKLYLSGRTRLQYEAMVRDGVRCGLMPLYAHRLKGVRGDSWRIFRVDTGVELKGRLRLLTRRIPALPLTRLGNTYLNWDEGLPLHLFLALTCRSEGERDTMRTLQDYSGLDEDEAEDGLSHLIGRADALDVSAPEDHPGVLQM